MSRVVAWYVESSSPKRSAPLSCLGGGASKTGHLPGLKQMVVRSTRNGLAEEIEGKQEPEHLDFPR